MVPDINRAGSEDAVQMTSVKGDPAYWINTDILSEDDEPPTGESITSIGIGS